MKEFSYKSFAKEIYDSIKSEILNGQLKEGDFITLAELSDKYKVSKTSIRDALVALEIEDYIISLPRNGYLINHFTRESYK